MSTQFDQKALFDLLHDIDEAEMSGVLFITKGQNAISTYFHSGCAIYAVVTASGTQGAKELNQQQLLNLYCQLRQGEYSFNGRIEPPPAHWRLRAIDLIMEAARLTEPANIYATIGDLDQALDPAFNLIERTQGLQLSRKEIEVLGQLEISYSINELIQRIGPPEIDTLRAVYALMCAGFINSPHADNDEKMRGWALSASKPPEPAMATAMPAARPTIPTALPAQMPAAMPSATRPLNCATTQPVIAQRVDPPPSIAAAVAVPNSSASQAVVEPVAKPQETTAKKRSKLNTEELEKLAGVKIRSMSGGRLDQDKKEFEEAERYYQLGCSALKAGNTANAEQFLRRAVTFAPDSIRFLIGLARLLSKSPKKQKEAEGFLIHACTTHMESVEARLALAELYESQSLKVKAETALNSVLKIDPNNKTAQQKLSMLKKGSSWTDELGGLFSRFLR